MLILETHFWQLLVDQAKQTSFFEWAGIVTTVLCIYLAARENILNWPVSIIAIVISAIIYYKSDLFGDFYLQFYFLFTAFYGWYFWITKKKINDKPVVSINLKQWLFSLASIIVLTIILGWLLDNYTKSNVPYEDGFCTAMSFVAQIMLTRKMLQNWILWIIVDICYVPLLIYKGLNMYALLYAFLVVLAVKGYLDWRKTYREQTN
ncbi:MAG: nicotinamide riboside transporter PnuC [Pedobacter sp.]|nr:MAG: nicotinamide riboside transporter PnuC [Pedobacter sp.]